MAGRFYPHHALSPVQRAIYSQVPRKAAENAITPLRGMLPDSDCNLQITVDWLDRFSGDQISRAWSIQEDEANRKPVARSTI